jgi:hypothetical protein
VRVVGRFDDGRVLAWAHDEEGVVLFDGGVRALAKFGREGGHEPGTFELAALGEREEKKKELEKEQKAMDEAQVMQKQFHKKIMEQVQIEDEINQQKKSIEARLSEIGNLPDLSEKELKQKRQLEEALINCESETIKMQKRLDEYFKQQDVLTDQILDMQSQCESFVHEIESLNNKVKEVRSWDKKSPPLAQIKVTREIFQNSSINGPNSMLILKDTFRNVTIREIRHADFEAEWEMRIDPN